MMPPPLKSSQIIGEAKRLLEQSGFKEADPIVVGSAREHLSVGDEDEEALLADVGPSGEVLVFEDERRIVGLILYESWSELAGSWEVAQAEMVARISQHLRRSDPKSWDGYLVLMTRDECASVEDIARVRHDTRRLRKLVATGRELTSISAIADTLLPVLPFRMDQFDAEPATLADRLPEMLATKGVDLPLANAALASFRENRSPMEGVWSWRKAQ